MVSIATTTTISKSLQAALSVILIGLTSKLLSNRSSLSTASELLSEYNSSTNGTSLDLSNTWKIEVASLSSSTYTLVSTVFNYFYPTTALSLFSNAAKVATDPTISDYSFITLSAEEFASSGPLSVSTFHTSYITSLTSSETVSNAFWFVNMIVQISDFASSDCGSVSDLLDSYNLTGVSTTESHLNYFNLNSGTSNTSNVYEEFYSVLTSLNLTNFEDFSLTDLNGTTLQSDLILALSGDCSIKKSAMALTILIWVSHLIFSGLLTTELVSYYNKFSSTKTKAIKRVEQAKKVAEQIEEEEGKVDAEEAPEIKLDANTILLTFSHRWGLFDISFKNALTPTEEE